MMENELFADRLKYAMQAQNMKQVDLVRAAAGCDLERVMDFNHSLIDAMKDAEYKPGWKKGIYPTRESIADNIAA